MLLRAILLAIGIVCGSLSSIANAQEMVPKALIDRIERQMVMPRHETIVADYQRFYVLGEEDGRSFVEEDGRSFVFVVFWQFRGREHVPGGRSSCDRTPERLRDDYTAVARNV